MRVKTRKHSKTQLDALARSRAATQFGGERGNVRNQEKETPTKPYFIQEVRSMCQAIAAARIDLKDKEAFEKLLLEMNDGQHPTVAQVAAASLARRAIGGNLEALEKFTQNIEGKLPETVNVNNSSFVRQLNVELEGDERDAVIEEWHRFAEKLPPLPKKEPKK